MSYINEPENLVDLRMTLRWMLGGTVERIIGDTPNEAIGVLVKAYDEHVILWLTDYKTIEVEREVDRSLYMED